MGHVKNSARKGFTLLEILLVVAAIAILAGIVILAINPAKQLADTRNAARRVDVSTVLNAVYQYAIDNNGSIPATVPGGTACGVATQEVCRTNSNCTGLVNLYDTLVGTGAKYLVGIPVDPSGGSTNGTRYEIFKNATTNRITVCAPDAEQGATISVTR